MTTIKSFIQQHVFLPLLGGSGRSGVLVVYDPDQRYRELCLELADERRRIVDASKSSIESREAALEALQQLGQPPDERPIDELIVYVPAKKPETDEQKQIDPFSICGACGCVFPSGDGDEYRSICLRAKPDYATEIRRIFNENPSPSFGVIDAVGGGAGWPNLQAVLGVESGREILLAFLSPSEKQRAKIDGSEAWVSEAKDLFQNSLGLKLVTRGKKWETVSEELWRYVLFSEFALVLPVAFPELLANVPRADAEAQTIVEDVCRELRDKSSSKPVYIERAEELERQLNLPAACAAIDDLGILDTFPFEERSFYKQAVDALQRDNWDKLREITARHDRSIWADRGENQAQWTLLQVGRQLMEQCDDVRRQLPDHSATMDALVSFYVTIAREVDRLQREFEQAVGDVDLNESTIETIVQCTRTAYAKCSTELHKVYNRHLESDGWPIVGRIANRSVFDRFVAPRLQERGRRVALILIDALRYELGVELSKQLADEGTVEIQGVCAQLPTITPVGMASLLPGAADALTIKDVNGQAVPFLGDERVKDLSQRLGILRSTYGERFSESPLRDFVKKKALIDEAVELLVLRSNDIDEQLESWSDTALALQLIQRSLKDIRVASRWLRDQGFDEVVIATDHGFVLVHDLEPGSVCEKPAGNWVNLHDRALLGDGASSSDTVVISAGQVGIRGDYAQVAFPRALVPFRAGLGYFHGGASLPEAVVPVITVQLRVEQPAEMSRPTVELTYKRGAKRITTRLPVIDVSVGSQGLFAQDSVVEILLEAHDRKGSVIGESKPGGPVNPATGTISIRPNTVVKIPIRMFDDFRGRFTLKALDPATTVVLASLDLETDYLE